MMDLFATCCGVIGFFLMVNLFFRFYTWLAKPLEMAFIAGLPTMIFSY
ncbi:hypothetical protein [Bacillus sp. RAR_GA_16]|nr:hypothetical protein [Bacillus sp. RAR_GA_16]MCA0172132.1 hypothetical protein [Bacillus sp. RAR_GA_16]